MILRLYHRDQSRGHYLHLRVPSIGQFIVVPMNMHIAYTTTVSFPTNLGKKLKIDVSYMLYILKKISEANYISNYVALSPVLWYTYHIKELL
jgi:hypothetical protein